MADHWDDLTVTPLDTEGRYTASISDAWVLAIAPQGGIVTAIALEAMHAFLDDDQQRLRTQTTVFAAPVLAGPIEIEVTVLRRGRSMSQLRAEVRNPGAAAGLTVLAVFGTTRPGPTFLDLTPPEVAGPDGIRSFRDPLPDHVDPERYGFVPRPFWEQVCEGRPAIGRAPWDPFEEGPSDVVHWYRYEHAPVVDGRLHRAVPVVACDMMPSSVAQKTGPSDPPWFGPSTDYTLHLFDPAPEGWLLGHLRARAGGDGYASVEMALWSEQRTLVAHATQVMFFTYLG